MNCSVFRSRRKDYTYIYLREDLQIDDLPASLLAAFGPPEFVIDLDLSPERKLASEDVELVLANLENQGFHLQLPPGDQDGDLI
jgi:uncharacterized protein YcgL (UPF0745 family)